MTLYYWDNLSGEPPGIDPKFPHDIDCVHKANTWLCRKAGDAIGLVDSWTLADGTQIGLGERDRNSQGGCVCVLILARGTMMAMEAAKMIGVTDDMSDEDIDNLVPSKISKMLGVRSDFV